MPLPFITVRTKSADETRAIGRVLGESAKPGDVLLLTGELGTGKTTFVQGLGAGLDVPERCTSPSFTLMHTYEGRYPLLHVDLYRCDRANEVLDLGLDDMLEPPWVVAIEWGEKAGALVGDDYLEVEFSWSADEDDVRLLKLRTFGRWQSRMHELTDSVRSWAAGGVT